MIVIDHERCAYCGGCVSVCPQEALTLNETHLVASDRCIDCGVCIPACPVGALHSGQEESTRGHPTRRRLQARYDVIVIGAGPGGSIAAQVAAEAGLSTLLLEKRQEIGSPVRCAEGVSHDQLIRFIEPDPRWIAAEITRASITARTDGDEQTLQADGGRGYVLERRIFDRVLAERAVAAGAALRVKRAATGLVMERGTVCGVTIRDTQQAHETKLQAELVIAADGVEAQVGRWAGLDLLLPPGDTMVCAQYLLAGLSIDPQRTCYTLSYNDAPGGYIWIFPKGEGKANVGLGIQADLWHRAALAPGGPALSYLQRFVENDPILSRGYPVTLVAGNVPVACSPGQLVTGGLMVIGDAARQVDPLTGGGIINAMQAGQMAAQVAIKAIEAQDVSAAFLSQYQAQWQQSKGRKLARNHRLRRRFKPEQRHDQRFVHAFLLAAGG